MSETYYDADGHPVVPCQDDKFELGKWKNHNPYWGFNLNHEWWPPIGCQDTLPEGAESDDAIAFEECPGEPRIRMINGSWHYRGQKQ
jgi:hypothetical protein